MSENKTSKFPFITTCVLSLLAFSGAMYGIKNTREAVLINQKNQARLAEVQHLQFKVQKASDIQDQFTNVSIEIRKVLDQGKRRCKKNIYQGNNELFLDQLRAAGFNVTKISIYIRDNFNRAIHQESVKLISIINNQENVCSPNAVTDKTLMQLSADIDEMMMNYINELEQKQQALLIEIMNQK